MLDRIYTISALTENSPGVLHRITAIFTRRKINVESLCVSETKNEGISRFTIGIKSDPELVKKLVSQIAKIIEVVEVYAHTDDELIYKELAFFRIANENTKTLSEIENLANRYSATMAHATKSSIVIEKVGTESDINSLYLLLEPYRVIEFVRSGRIAIEKK